MIAAVVMALVVPVTTSAQTPATNPIASPSPTQANGGACQSRHKGCRKGHHFKLTATEHQQLKVDMAKIHNDPKLVAARKTLDTDRETLRQTRRELLLQADPSVKPILDKIDHEQRWTHVKNWFRNLIPFGKNSTKTECHKGHGVWAKLTPAERDQLKADMKKIHADPKLVAARTTVTNDLKTLHQTAKELLLGVDPSIKPVLDKWENAEKYRHHKHHDGCEAESHCAN